MEKNNINKKKGKCPNPLLSFTTLVSQTFFIIIRFIVYIFSIKSMLIFFFFFFFFNFSLFVFFLKRRQKLKYFSKKYDLKHGKQDISQTTEFYKGCNWYVFVYTTQRERLHCEMQKSLNR